MIFNIILLALLATIAYFHYAEGFFSAALSTIIVVIAAVMAVSYHELLASYIVPKEPDWAIAVSLVGLFAAIYICLRLIFDKLVPGNIRFPLLVDKIGAGAVGIFAGLFATGVLALAGESMAFGPTMGGYSRVAVNDTRTLTLSAGRSDFMSSLDSAVYDDMKGDTLDDPDNLNHLWFHQDELVCGLVQQLSANGPLSNDIPLSMAHPNYPTELYGDQLGVPVGAVHAAPVDSRATLGIKGCFVHKPFMRYDPELPDVRPTGYKLPDLGMGDPGNWFVDVAVDMTLPALQDSDSLVRFGLANVRLVSGGVDYYPVGTLGDNLGLMQSKPDDPLFVDTTAGGTVVFVFVVDPQVVFQDPSSKKEHKLLDGTFLQVKRFARADLSGRDVTTWLDFLQNQHFPGKTTEKTDGGLLVRPWIKHNLSTLMRTMPGAAARTE